MKELYRFRQFLTEEDFKNPILDKYLELKKSIDNKTVFDYELSDFINNLDNTEREGLESDLGLERDTFYGGRLFEAIDFPELEDEFEGAMGAMVVEPKVYFQGIIDASAEEIVSDDYYEIMNAVEQGFYSEDEAVKLAKAWAKEKLSNLAEAPRDGVKSAATKLGIKPSHIRKENMYIDDEEFEMEMGRSKKDSLKKEMMMHVDQLMDGNIDMIDFMNVVEEIMLDVKIAAKDEELNKRKNNG